MANWTLDIDKFPKHGTFDCFFGRNYTPEKIAEKAKNWTGEDTLNAQLNGYGHILKEVKKVEPAKVEPLKEETKKVEDPQNS